MLPGKPCHDCAVAECSSGAARISGRREGIVAFTNGKRFGRRGGEGKMKAARNLLKVFSHGSFLSQNSSQQSITYLADRKVPSFS